MSVELIRRPVRRDAVYDRMLDEIRQAIVSRTLPPRSRILSETELCERYGISRVSVRTALAKLEKGGLIVKKNGLGSFVSDPDDPAFSPQPEVCDIAINITDVNLGVYWYYAKIQRAAAAAAPLYNAKLSMVNEISAATITPMLWQGLLAISADCNSELEAIADRGVEVALFNRISTHPRIASIYVDYYEESCRAVRRLIDRGHKKIAILTPDDGGTSKALRVGGYLRALDRSFPEPDLFCPLFPNRPELEAGIILDYFKNHRPDAVFIPYGAHFLPFITVMNKLKIRIPQDMEVVSFDDIGEMRSLCEFPFSYIKMPLAEMTRDAIRYLSEKIEGKESVPVLRKKYPVSFEVSD